MTLEQWIEDLRSDDSQVRARALRNPPPLGPEARAAVPALISVLKRDRSDWLYLDAVAALGKIGPEARAALPHLLPMVQGDNWHNVSATAGFAILQVGGTAEQERQAVRFLLGPFSTGGWDSYPVDIWDNPQAGELLRPRIDRLLPFLTEYLADERFGIYAARALAACGPSAAAAAPAVAARMQAAAPQARVRFALTLAAIDNGRKGEAVAALLALLADPATAQVYEYAERGPISVCDALRRLGEDPVPHLLALLRRHTGEARDVYVNTLFALGESCLPALEQELKGPGAVELLGAARALVKIAPHRVDAAMPHLVAGLGAADVAVRRTVITVLRELGNTAAAAAPALVGLLADPEAGLEAALALVDVDAARAQAAVPVLAQALERGQAPPGWSAGQAESAALQALDRIGPAAAAAAPAVGRVLESPHPETRVEAARTLARVAPERRAEAAAALVRAAEAAVRPDFDGDPNTAYRAVEALKEVGPAAVEDAPRLEAVLSAEGDNRLFLSGADLLAVLLRSDPAAADRVRGRIEADLASGDRLESAVGLLNELAPEAPLSWAPLWEGLLQDPRAERHRDALRSRLEELRARAAEGSAADRTG